MGVEAQYVRETVEVQRLIMLPGTSNIFSGFMNLRGRTIPIVNLNRLFGRSVPYYTLSLILEAQGNVLGLPVAEVIGYQQYDGNISESDIFNVTEIAYEDVEVLSLSALNRFVVARLQTL